MTEKSNRDGDTVRYAYNNDGTLAIVKDSGSGITTRYYYDDVGRDARYTETGVGRSHSVSYSYDDFSRLYSLTETIGTSRYTTYYGYDARSRLNSQITGITETNSVSVVYNYDDFGRLRSQTHQLIEKSTQEENGEDSETASVTSLLKKKFTYTTPDSETATNQVATCEVSIPAVGYSTEYSYEYDVSGNILEVRADASTTGKSFTSYAYDCMNQLVRENNQAGNVTYVWEYNSAGNILSRKEYPYTSHEQAVVGEPLDTVTYTYDGDILTSYDGKAVSGYQWGTYVYDGWTYETVRGNRLVGMTKWDYDANCEVARTFTYDANGMRTQRVEPDGTTYNYVYNGSLLSQMTVGSNTLYFTYDADGTPLTVTYNGTTITRIKST